MSLFPIHNPKVKTLLFVHLQSNGLSCLFSHLPMKGPSVFCTLTLAPVASSNNLSCWKTSFIDLSFVTMIWVSSAYCKIFCSILLIVIPLISLFDQIRFPRTSAMITYRRALSGSSCRTPIICQRREMKCGIFARRAMIDQAREGLCYQRINLTFLICLT